MKTVLEYLRERREMAEHNLCCYSASGIVPKPKDGYADRFKEAVRDCEIVDELITLVKKQSAPTEKTAENAGAHC